MSDNRDIRAMEWLWHVDIDLRNTTPQCVANTARDGLRCLENLQRDTDGCMLLMVIVKKPVDCA